ncbi:putative acyltransferase ChoActase/COT/CPT, choline/carnitine acyltransferase [Plasmopara halstedii]
MRLPIPKLKDTLARYLAAVEPVVTPQQLKETKRAVADFQNGLGPTLHHALLARDAANKHTSYINQWWLEMYLTIGSAPDKLQSTDKAQNGSCCGKKLSESTCGIVDCIYCPLKHLFSSTRVPRLGRDELKVTPDSTHVVVQRARNGLLTTMNRDAWANARQKLKAMMHESPSTVEAESRCFLAGDGSNHWFDKSFQLIVAANGMASVSFEHAWGDGVAVLRYLNELYNDSVKYPVLKASTQAKLKTLLDVNGEIKQLLNEAKQTYNKWVSTLVTACAETPVTRAVGKQYDIGTDGLMQMTIQLAHFKLHQTFVARTKALAQRHLNTDALKLCAVAQTKPLFRTYYDESVGIGRRKGCCVANAVNKTASLRRMASWVRL